MNPQAQGSSASFTAKVSSSATGPAAPSGTVAFYDGTTQIGSSPLSSNLTASFKTASLALGSHSITASYGGDTHYAASTSPVLIESIVASVGAADLNVTSSPSSLTLPSGKSGTLTVAVGSVGGFQGTVDLA